MSAQTQIDANRANAAQSTGPKTEAGKQTSSMNAMQHGMRSAKILLPGEDPAELETLRAKLLAEFAPTGAEQEFSVNEMIDAQWKLRRVDDAERRTLTENPNAIADGSIEKIQRYRTSLTRAFYKASRELARIRKQTADNARRLHDRQFADWERDAEQYLFGPLPGPSSAAPPPVQDAALTEPAEPPASTALARYLKGKAESERMMMASAPKLFRKYIKAEDASKMASFGKKEGEAA